MKKTLKVTDIIALGFMTFAFFLGAGNIIFPPLAGQLAGENMLSAMFGFLVTAVGLPLIGIIAVAMAGGGWQGLTRDLPSKIATLMAVLIFIIIGPAFAAPRTGLVAYEMAVKPFMAADAGQASLTTFSVIFFAVALFFAWSRGQLIDMIGKFLTPALFIVLAILAIAVFVNPQGSIVAAQGEYVTQAFTKGFLEGYNTMDTFAALMFGMLIVDVIRSKGVSDEKTTCTYLIYAGLIAAAGLAFVYISLFYLGATSTAIAPNAANGGVILTGYVMALFGAPGQVILSAIVLLACLTTAIGLISACADYFSSLTSLSYKKWAVILAVICAVVANVGLNQLIALSVPVLFALYPVAIALVALTLVRKWLPNPRLAYRVVLLVSFIFSMIDVAKYLKFDVSMFSDLPLFNYGMAWVLPTLIALAITRFVGGKAMGPQDKLA
ncbi:branched-chain amino acid transport system II carrier protein [Photobacterium sp. GB-27]|uniref:branched-chain amino acid transport system II carrier protein n=1 Tax=unclassified Photobacterium TaxID=2628852 RepID=UPI000D17AF4D|nr:MULTISPECIES: branched-chain amino acid transport system II carrier protein [unclassified Photobacterium]PSV31059.1 branched-chain amino acid transport system II carrier protein [Photobacterium sp. GB-72]PSV36927.1 branched-chain amino acid transport system II carrier protein [Photobacterium sp. GB-27]PSV36989.1 branched-chain amino acid transport system II carrier protein [Photobacterium sp. GB-210]PSV43999.1 branched-chain amino acid transport system II carrier protein [Photobacterium sp. 